LFIKPNPPLRIIIKTSPQKIAHYKQTHLGSSECVFFSSQPRTAALEQEALNFSIWKQHFVIKKKEDVITVWMQRSYIVYFHATIQIRQKNCSKL
jgi:hypothetical protein